MDKLIVTTVGLAAIGWVYWFFFQKNEEQPETHTSWNILVDGGYVPATVTVKSGKPSALTFNRTDQNVCLEEIVIPEFKIKTFLPLNEPVTVTLSPTQPGIYEIRCGMNMYHGRIIVL